MRFIAFFVGSLLLSGCATVFNGYTAEIEIRNAPDSLQVFTQDGIALSVAAYKTKSTRIYTDEYQTYKYAEKVDSSARFFLVRSNRDYILHLKTGNREYQYPAYAKLSGWWFALDCVCGGLPIVVDAITGNWNYYDPIEFGK